MAPLQLLLIAPDPLARTALQNLLASEQCNIVGHGDGNDEWDELVSLFEPNVILCDLGWQSSCSLPDLRELDVPTIVLVADEDAAQEAWQAGAKGIIGREVVVGLDSAEILHHVLHTVRNNLTVTDPKYLAHSSISNLSISHTEGSRPATSPISNLDITPREHQVLTLLAQGLTNRAIAHQLDISDHTVKFHVNALLTKLGAQSRTEAAVTATRLGLLPI